MSKLTKLAIKLHDEFCQACNEGRNKECMFYREEDSNDLAWEGSRTNQAYMELALVVQELETKVYDIKKQNCDPVILEMIKDIHNIKFDIED